MPYYAQINEARVVVAVTETSGIIEAPHMIEIQSMNIDLLGSIHDAETDEFDHPEPPTPTPPAWAWYIDIGPFYDRFGGAKMAVLTSTDAGLKAILADLNIRKWVDLERADVAQALAYVGSVVPAVTPALQTAILTTPVAEVENLALRKLYFS